MAHASNNVRGVATRTGISVALVVGAIVVSGLLTVPIVFGIRGVETGWTTALTLLAGELGYLIAAVAFLALRSDRSFVPVHRPNGAQLRIGAFAVGGGIVAEATRQLAVELTSLGAASTVPGVEAGPLGIALTLLAVVVVAPPAEELLFRGVVQRYVADVSSTRGGIAVATLLFVPVHVAGIALTAQGYRARSRRRPS